MLSLIILKQRCIYCQKKLLCCILACLNFCLLIGFTWHALVINYLLAVLYYFAVAIIFIGSDSQYNNHFSNVQISVDSKCCKFDPTLSVLCQL